MRRVSLPLRSSGCHVQHSWRSAIVTFRWHSRLTGSRLGCWLAASRSYVSLRVTFVFTHVSLSAALLVGAGLWASRFLASPGGGRLLGCTFLLTYVSLVVGTFWGLHLGVSGCCLFGSHIRWWSHFLGSHFGGGQGSFSVSDRLVVGSGFAELFACSLTRAGGQGLRVAGGYTSQGCGLAHSYVSATSRFRARAAGCRGFRLVQSYVSHRWASLHPVAATGCGRHPHPWVTATPCGASPASGGYCSPWGHVSCGLHMAGGYGSTRTGALAVRPVAGCTSVTGGSRRSYAAAGS